MQSDGIENSEIGTGRFWKLTLQVWRMKRRIDKFHTYPYEKIYHEEDIEG
jgi:hypothetical protein